MGFIANHRQLLKKRRGGPVGVDRPAPPFF